MTLYLPYLVVTFPPLSQSIGLFGLAVIGLVAFGVGVFVVVKVIYVLLDAEGRELERKPE